MRPFHTHNGNVLVVTLIFIAILSALAIGLSELVVGDLRLTRLTGESIQARYAAESGVERALLTLKNQPVGFEETLESQVIRSDGTDASFQAAISQRRSQIPAEGFAPLRLNESVTIPLFRDGTPGGKVQDLRIEYYLDAELAELGGHLAIGVDMLRFKIFGVAPHGGTESINEYFPPVAPLGASQGDASEATPCIGTPSHCWNAGSYFKHSPARTGFSTERHEAFPIESFLREHNENVLVLTNIINTDVIAGIINQQTKEAAATIYYRVVEGQGQNRLLDPTIHISADGIFGRSKESVDVTVNRDQLLPVFHFALYRTCVDCAE